MDKRYQVFISSTFTDLKYERQAALKAVLELDHMPAGMELFPAADDAAWQLIKDVIDASDYYVLIVGGRYGSLDEQGLGYTEKEYDYATLTAKPVIPLLHQNPDNLPRDKTETDQAAWAKLQAFRTKVEKRHTCVYWSSADDLKAKLIVGVTATLKRRPAIGWIRADQVPSGATLSDVLTLRKRIEELEGELESERRSPPPGTEDLRQGDDVFEVSLTFVARPHGSTYPHSTDTRYNATIEPSWNEIFAAVAPKLINEASDQGLRTSLEEYFTQRAQSEFGDDDNLKEKILRGFDFRSADFDTCIVQLRALGLLTESRRKRSVHDTRTYWALTPFGDGQMVRLRALRKTPAPAPRPSGKARRSDEEEGIV